MKTAAKKSKVNLQAFINFMFIELKGTEEQIAADKKKAESSLYNFLTWATPAYEHAAYHHWLAIYIDVAKQFLQAKKTLEDFREHITNNHLQQSATLITSSGICNNLMEAADRAAKARIINYLNHGIRFNGFE